MTVSRRDVEHIARLAALSVDDQSLPELTGQIGRILDYVSQLEAVRPEGGDAGIDLCDRPQALRSDEPRRTELNPPLAQLAPAFADGLFLVPRLGTMDEA
jgi:aspartyl-tRNA(Asn)/glutamyl-tRNA(Gln) amidotransferase subunit C